MAPLILAVLVVLALLVIALAAGAGTALLLLGASAVNALAGSRSERPLGTPQQGARLGGAPAPDAEAPPLPPELDSLPDAIKKKILVNPEVRGLYPNPDFLPAIGASPELRALDEAISAGCVAEPSPYEQSKPGVVDGYAVRIFPRGWRIYKAFLGFLSEKQVRGFAEKNPDRPSWMGDKYLTYAIARTDWGSIVSFELKQDLVLLDYFHLANLEKLLAEIESLSAEFPRGRSARDVVRAIRIATGYGLTPAEHLKILAELYPGWRGLWFYTEPRLPLRTSLHCHHRRVEGLNPLGAVRDVHATDLSVFDVVLARHPGIDGLVRDSVLSQLDESGVFYHEEYLVKGSAQIAKLAFDYRDPVCWVNWNIRGFTPPKEGLHLEYSVKKFASSDRISPNSNFALARFYVENAPHLPPAADLPRPPLLFFYNVHSFASLNANVPEAATRRHIEQLIGRYASTVEIVSLAEVSLTRTKISGLLADAGFGHAVVVDNGARDHSSRLVVAAKTPLDLVAVVDTSVPAPAFTEGRVNPIDRKQVVFRTQSGMLGAAVHLEIGRRLVVNNETVNEERRKGNAAIRIGQLETLLKHPLDFIAGDFNFTLEDPEVGFLADRGFVPTHTGDQNSTPYNRVDLFFVRRGLLKGLGPASNILLKCNYSDHLPMVQSLPVAP